VPHYARLLGLSLLLPLAFAGCGQTSNQASGAGAAAVDQARLGAVHAAAHPRARGA